MNEYVSYADAAFAAIKMVEGLNPKAFYDEIPSKKGPSFMLNYKGISLLGGIMGVKVVELTETEESDETQIVIKSLAENPQGDLGYGWLSRPKKGYQDKEDEDWREKAYTHAKRNCMRDLVPYQLFLEMLIAKSAGKPVATENPTKPKEVSPLESAKTLARKAALKNFDEGLSKGMNKEEAGEMINIITASTEEKFDAKQDSWTPSQWIEFAKIHDNFEVLLDLEDDDEEESEPDESPEQNAKDVLDADGLVELANSVDAPEESESEEVDDEDELPEIELPDEDEGDEEESEESEEVDNEDQLTMLLEEVDQATKKK